MPKAAISQRKALDIYYAAIENYQHQGVTQEQATRLAFSTLLDTLARGKGWTLVLEKKLLSGLRPDGTLIDAFKLDRGYWEAKDTDDDLDAEIQNKIKLGYPLINTVFEDTQHAVLYQNGREAFTADLTNRTQLLALLDQFFNHSREQIESFNAAVQEFQSRIPELAQALLKIIDDERKGNTKFVAAFNVFHELCKSAIDPNISAATIEEMLVQHLLTERLFRTVFDNPDFTQHNAIAAEIEKVIKALTSRAFSRRDFLKQLDHFYIAIEDTAKTIDDFTQKQAFLNTVYERFFQGFSQKQADTHGIVYTPQPIVDFMCASIEAILQREFGLSLSDKDVIVLDPVVGTGNYIVNMLRRINRRDLKRKYTQELFCNEIMLLPYYIASLNIEHAYFELAKEYEPFGGICFADTLDMKQYEQSQQLPMFGEENTARVEQEKKAKITVVLGNPPYNVGQKSENEANKNRVYQVVDQRIRDTYVKDSSATKTKTHDAYIRFFRWATDRLGDRDGIVCFVSNNSFVNKDSLDGMRKHLTQDFTAIYHLDLHGDVRMNPKLSGTTHNVFGIQVGVGITMLVRNRNKTSEVSPAAIYYHRVPEDWRKEQKLDFLVEKKDLSGIDWQTLTPNAKQTWLTEGLREDFDSFISMGTKESKANRALEAQTIFKTYSLGISTNRDDIAYDFDRGALGTRVEHFIEEYNAEVSRWARARIKKSVDDFVDYEKLKWSRNLKRNLRNENYIEFDASNIRQSLYRPFVKQWIYHAESVVDELGQTKEFFPVDKNEIENITIVVSDHGHRSPFSVLTTSLVPDLHILASTDGFQCFPFYVYDEDGSNRRENITDWALQQFQAQYGSQVTKRDIFYYVYAMLHHPRYRERYAENLKRELPRIPFVDSKRKSPVRGDFNTFVRVGQQLADLHLHSEQATEFKLKWLENKDVPFSWRVEKMKLTLDKSALVVNESLTLSGIPAECFDYRLGNRSALEWIIDQYQVSTDKRSGITTDPNRADDPEYIVRLVGRVITVSVETVKLVRELESVS